MASITTTINHDWDRTAASPAARAALASWARTWPVFAPCGDLRDVLAARCDPTRAQEVLRPLALMAPVDELAARTLLQALLPGLLSMTRGLAGDDVDGLDELVALAWERIRTYPGQRQGSVAGNVLLDVRKRYLALHAVREHAADHQELARRTSTDPIANLDHGLVQSVLRDAVDAGVVSPDELEVIVRSRMFDVPLAEIAQERGVTPRSLGKQRWRAEDRLRRMPQAEQLTAWRAA